jgi:hypothetical protein
MRPGARACTRRATGMSSTPSAIAASSRTSSDRAGAPSSSRTSTTSAVLSTRRSSVSSSDADRGGLVVRHRGRPTVLEELRLPLGFDVAIAPAFNINTLYFDAAALSDLHPDWTYFAVKKKIDGTEVVQFERILNELVDWLPTRFLRVARSGEEARFLPVKDHAELLAHRATIEAVVRTRGILA